MVDNLPDSLLIQMLCLLFDDPSIYSLRSYFQVIKHFGFFRCIAFTMYLDIVYI
jgi:hypothetical protein